MARPLLAGGALHGRHDQRGEGPLTQADLFAQTYPDAPGWKGRDTSKAAAQAIAPKAQSLRERVLVAVTAQPGSPEQIARRIGVPLMNVRPRLSELAARGLVVDTGRREIADGGRKAIVWQAVR